MASMKLPEELQEAIDHFVQHSPALREARRALTQNYKAGQSSPFADVSKRLAYLGYRLPATYSAVHKVLEEIPFAPDHVLDLGAGPGTASWAAIDLFPNIQKVTLIEKSLDAIDLGKGLSSFSSHPALQSAEWLCQSLLRNIPQADLGILSYVLNELTGPERIVEECWKSVSCLVIVEPGTPKNFQLLKKIRQQLIDLNAHIVAPCPHALACPMQGKDWCHFSARVERSRLHRLLKEGSLGYEDEKFSYLIAAKISQKKYLNRIIRQPLKQSGHVHLSLCSETGSLEEKIVTRKQKELYRLSRDAEWGDEFSM